MHTPKIFNILLLILITTSNGYAQENPIEISEYLDHLHQQFINSKLFNSEQGISVRQSGAHVELNIVTKKNKKGVIQSYVVQSGDNSKAASAHKLSFDIDFSQRPQKPTTKTSLESETVVTTPTDSSVEKATNQTLPWYKHYFTW